MPRCKLFPCIFACILVAAAYISTASAQQSLGSVAGRILDPQGGSIAGASVSVTNTETNSSRHTVADESGYYEVNLLNPGTYAVAAEAPGFKKAIRGGLTLNVASRLDLDVQLQIGQTTETVEVTSQAPLLETSKASGGRVIDNHQIMQLPFSDMNPFALATLAAGMQWTGQPEYRRPFDNGGTSSFNTAGGVGSNEYTIDGAPATGTGRRVGYVPPSDAVDEFKLETSSFDASYGHSSGATINVSTKSGTNTYHGSLYDQHWQQRWNATQHFSRLAFNDAVRRGKTSPDAQRQAPGRSNNFGGTLGGPVRIPKIFNGRDKLFFFFSYNGIYQSKAETTDAVNRSVPKLAWRQGDFSDLLAIDPVKYTIYDPRTARLVNGRVVRDPFPGNKGIPVLNPMYDAYVKLYPAPNNVPGLVTPEGTDNYLATALPKNEKFNSLINRFDYNISDRHRVFGRWYWNHRLADEYDWTYETARGLHTNGLTRINKGIGGDYIWTINNRNIVDFGVNVTRFNEGSESPVRTQFKAVDVKLPGYIDQKAGDLHELPRISFSNLESVGASYPAIGARGTVGEAKAQVTSMLGRHSLKYGFEERRYWYTSAGPGNTSGNFTFNNTFTKAADNTSTASNTGLEWAAFMLGLPSGISIDTNDSGYWKTPWRSLYLQDDWRIHPRATLSVGLRFEHEGGTSERFNRGLGGGFDFNAKLPFTDAVQAAYAANPLNELPANQFKVLGGSYYLGDNGTNTWTNGVNHFMPRIGLVYSLNDKTVIRTGYGTYYDTFNVTNDRPGQDGFSQATGTTLTNDQGLTFCCGVGSAANLTQGRTPLADPFPVRADGTRFDTPYGNKIGPEIRFGRGFSYVPRNYSPAGQQRWRFGVQREIRKDMVIEVSYNGAFARIPVNQRIDFLPSQYWATGNTRNQALDDDLNKNVPNPFNIKNYPELQSSNPVLYKYLGTQGFFTSSTIRKHQLLRAFPQINNFNGLRPGNDFSDSRGSVNYHDVEVQFEKRFSRGFQTAVLYTYANSEKQDYYLNEFDTRLSSRPNDLVLPHRFVWTAIYELPFGKGKQFLKSGPLQHILGGWQASWVYQRQTGPPIDWGNRFFYGDLDNLGKLLNHDAVHGQDIHVWFDPSIAYKGAGPVPQGFQGFEGRSGNQPGTFQTRVFPVRLDVVRADGIRNWDVKAKRNFHIHERLNTSFAVDLLNATNHTNFDKPNTDPTNNNFGRVTSQRGLSRVIQFNLRVDF